MDDFLSYSPEDVIAANLCECDARLDMICEQEAAHLRELAAQLAADSARNPDFFASLCDHRPTKASLASDTLLQNRPLLGAHRTMLAVWQSVTLCRELELGKCHHYSVTAKVHTCRDNLDEAARRNLMMMNIFNSLKKMSKLPMAELIDAVSFAERMLKAERAGMYDRMYDKTKDDYRAKIVRLCKKQGVKEYDFVKRLVAKADELGEHVGWQLFPPKRWEARARGYVWIVALGALALAAGFALWAAGGRG